MEKEDDSEDSSSTNTPAKTEVDGGWGWMVVFGAFMINVITDGCSYSFGVLFTHLVDYFQANRSFPYLTPPHFYLDPLPA